MLNTEIESLKTSEKNLKVQVTNLNRQLSDAKASASKVTPSIVSASSVNKRGRLQFSGTPSTKRTSGRSAGSVRSPPHNDINDDEHLSESVDCDDELHNTSFESEKPPAKKNSSAATPRLTKAQKNREDTATKKRDKEIEDQRLIDEQLLQAIADQKTKMDEQAIPHSFPSFLSFDVFHAFCCFPYFPFSCLSFSSFNLLIHLHPFLSFLPLLSFLAYPLFPPVSPSLPLNSVKSKSG